MTIHRGGLRAARTWGNRILIADHDEEGGLALKHALEALGHDVHQVYDGPSALQVSRTFRPDVALLEIGLHIVDGYDLAQKIGIVRSGGTAVRLIALTASGKILDCERAKLAGFTHHFVKPVNIANLASRLAQR